MTWPLTITILGLLATVCAAMAYRGFTLWLARETELDRDKLALVDEHTRRLTQVERDQEGLRLKVETMRGRR